MACLINSIASSAYRGLPVSTEAAQKTFCALGDDWWKQLFDGVYQEFGKMVFDLGLHGYDKEPGFYESAWKAFQLANNSIGKEFNAGLYCDLNRVACAHFEGKKNNTEMNASEAGSFRNSASRKVQCISDLGQVMRFFDRTDLKDDSRAILINEFLECNSALKTKFTEVFDHPEKFEVAFKEIFDILKPKDALILKAFFEKKMSQVQNYLDNLRKDPISGAAYPAVGFSLPMEMVLLVYKTINAGSFSFEDVIPYVIGECNRSIAEIDAKLAQTDLSNRDEVEKLTDQKLTCIADLYQKLEWLHPFPDGQGRTDLITLGMLLSKHGFCPAILEDPYVSSFALLDDWVGYLKEGMVKWQEAAKAAVIFNQSV